MKISLLCIQIRRAWYFSNRSSESGFGILVIGNNNQCSRVCCRSPIIPARPSYSAELMSLSYSGSLPRSSGSAPDLTAVAAAADPHHRGGTDSSPVTDIWTNPQHQQQHSAVSTENFKIISCLCSFYVLMICCLVNLA